MQRAFVFTNAGPQLTVTLTYYASPQAQSPWYVRTLQYDTTDPTIITTVVLDDISQWDRKVKLAYDSIATMTTALGDRLGVRESI